MHSASRSLAPSSLAADPNLPWCVHGCERASKRSVAPCQWGMKLQDALSGCASMNNSRKQSCQTKRSKSRASQHTGSQEQSREKYGKVAAHHSTNHHITDYRFSSPHVTLHRTTNHRIQIISNLWKFASLKPQHHSKWHTLARTRKVCLCGCVP